jgi:hypothetical protein
VIRELDTVVTADHSDGMRHVGHRAYNRQRTIHMRFVRTADGSGYQVQAWGSAFPDDGCGGYQGHVPHPAATLNSGIDVLRQTWQRRVVEHQHTDERTGRAVFPFVNAWDLSGEHGCAHWEEIGLALARAGHTVFTLLFGGGDPGMREIAGHLVAALRDGEHVITMESDDLFVPWGMLYTPPTAEESLFGTGATWSLDGFWGYRHLVEHGFSRVPWFDSRIAVAAGGITVGLNVDEDVDHEYPHTPFVKPVIDFFTGRTQVVVRRSKEELAGAFQDPAFADHITYFGCHGAAGGTDGQAGQPYLVLGDGEKIYSAELVGWLTARLLPTRPLVFVGACQGGRLSSLFYPGFGHHLLNRGARCLVGPQVDLPRAFAGEYTTRLFSGFLEPGAKLGDLVRSQARSFADRHRNPLGLIFSLYRGMDVHLWPTATP